MNTYGFVLSGNALSILCNGTLQNFGGEETYTLDDEFWEIWQENMAYESGDMSKCIFLGDDREKLQEFIDSSIITADYKDIRYQDIVEIVKELNKEMDIKVQDKIYTIKKNGINYDAIITTHPKNLYYSHNLQDDIFENGSVFIKEQRKDIDDPIQQAIREWRARKTNE